MILIQSIGVTLDQTLSYKHHLIKTAAKLKSRNNLLSKSNWQVLHRVQMLPLSVLLR